MALARAVATKVDRDPARRGLRQARETCARWMRENPTPAAAEWQAILDGSWEQVREVLLADNQEGQRLRQSSPFCGVLTPAERWAIYRRFQHEPRAA